MTILRHEDFYVYIFFPFKFENLIVKLQIHCKIPDYVLYVYVLF